MRDERLITDEHGIPLRSETPQGPFLRRIGWTCALLAVAAAAHLWVVPRVDVTPGGPVDAAREATARAASSRQARADSAASVVAPAPAPAPSPQTSEEVSSLGRSSKADSRSIPDGTYPAAQAPIGTGGKLRPASLLQESREASRVSTPLSKETTRNAQDDSASAPPPVVTETLAAESRDTAPRSEPPVTPPVPESEPPVDDEGESLGKGIAEEELVHIAVQEYRSAYERLDAMAAKNVWPSVDASALRHAFNQLAEQRLNFESCGVSIRGDLASARCRGQAEYLPKVGSRRALVKAGEWVFDLARQDTAWHIVSARIQ